MQSQPKDFVALREQGTDRDLLRFLRLPAAASFTRVRAFDGCVEATRLTYALEIAFELNSHSLNALSRAGSNIQSPPGRMATS